MKTFTFRVAGLCITLNRNQLNMLLGPSPGMFSWPTYWALRRRNLLEGSEPTRRTKLGDAVIEEYKRKYCSNIGKEAK